MKLLILDRDETLIHATERPLDHPMDFSTEMYSVYKRPFVDEFLRFCRVHFHVGVWTTADSDFAKNVVDNVFSKDFQLQFIWSHERCTRQYDSELMEAYYVKDLAKLKRKGYRLEYVIIVDDTPRKLERNYGNLVQIQEWVGDHADRELLRLMKYLVVLNEVENIRLIEKRSWEKQYTVD